jgi:hypothetical protein
LALVFGILGAAGPGAYAADLNESVAGDFSDTPSSPTPWSIDSGANVLTGRAGTNSSQGAVDYDLIAFTIPAQRQLTSIVLTLYQNENPFAMAFAGMQAGPQWTDALGVQIDGGAMMGWTHIDSTMTNFDLLGEMQSHANDPVFDIPLPSGTYTLLLQDIDTTFDYSLTFNVLPVPESAGAAMAWGLAAGVLGLTRRRGAV